MTRIPVARPLYPQAQPYTFQQPMVAVPVTSRPVKKKSGFLKTVVTFALIVASVVAAFYVGITYVGPAVKQAKADAQAKQWQEFSEQKNKEMREWVEDVHKNGLFKPVPNPDP